MKRFYITTAIPYVNARPHLGHALEIVQADTIARYRRLAGDDVFFLTGTDENALKNVLAAKEQNVPVKELVDKNSQAFRDLKQILNLSWDDFIRTTEPRHIRSAQKLWSACKKDDIYKKKYKGLYCVGCEEFKTSKDLENGRCTEHPNLPLQAVEEENYFFRLSAYQKELQKLVESDKLEVIPETRKNEMLSFVKQGLEDFSISRSRERAEGRGIPVPGDESQVQYVWFDALTNYIAALGYSDDGEKLKHYWENGDEIVHVVGKGVQRFHAIYWPAMLLSAGLRLPTKVFAHGYLTVEGQKVSKSLGNVTEPAELVKRYGTDAVRYYLLREIPAYDDGDFSYKKFEERYNGDLANGLGNFAARVLTLGGKETFGGIKQISKEIEKELVAARKTVEEKMVEFKFHEALAAIWGLIGFGDAYVNEKQPWAIKEKEERTQTIFELIVLLDNIAALLQPFLPETAAKITNCIHWDGTLRVKRGEALFPRIA